MWISGTPRCTRKLVVSRSALPSKSHPTLNFAPFGDNVTKLREDPPMWLIDNFVSKGDCEALIQEGQDGSLPGKVYEGSFVLFDEERLKPLILVPFLCAAASFNFHDSDYSAGFIAFIASLAAIALLKELVRWFMGNVAGGNGRGGAHFLGQKWQLGPPLPNTRAASARNRLFQRVTQLCCVKNSLHLEPPFLTRYQDGEGQSTHVDTRERPHPGDSAEVQSSFWAAGGQRMVQCLCYLNSVDIEKHGGATCFHSEALGNFKVEPKVGRALVFCTAFADGQEDLRMVHSAEPLRGPVEKWVVPVWSLEAEHSGWNEWEEIPVKCSENEPSEPGVSESRVLVEP